MRKFLILSLFFCLLGVNSPVAQVQSRPQPPPPDPLQSRQARDPQFGSEREKDPTEEKMEHQREKELNKQRQLALQKDTDHLLELATQLKEYVDKSNEHTLSLDVVKKADEIEKLAKSVKDKMKGN